MRKAIVIAALLTLTATLSTTASAQELEGGHGVGIGVQENLGGLIGATLDYDAGRFRLEFILGFNHESNPSFTAFGLGGRFFYVVHHMDRADLGLGGGVGLLRTEPVGGGTENNIHLEAGAQIRAFLTSNVAVSGAVGLVVVIAENDINASGPITTAGPSDSAIGVGGQLLAGFGVTYYFR